MPLLRQSSLGGSTVLVNFQWEGSKLDLVEHKESAPHQASLEARKEMTKAEKTLVPVQMAGAPKHIQK